MAGRDKEFEAPKGYGSQLPCATDWHFRPRLGLRSRGSFTRLLVGESNPDFDQFPVNAATSVGILLREADHGGGTVREAMQPLREGLVISADMPILT